MLEPQQVGQINKQMMTIPARICRFCLYENTDCEVRPLMHLFQKFNFNNVIDKIENCLNLKLSPNDPIPPIICQACMEKINYFSDFQELCSKSERQLRRLYGLEPSKCEDNVPFAEVATGTSVTWISDERIRTACKTESDFSVSYQPLRKPSSHHVRLSRKKSVPVQRSQSRITISMQEKQKVKHNEVKSSKSVSSFKCLICKKKFSNMQDLQQHTKTTHDKETIYKCGTCDKVFMDEDKFYKHEQNHKVPCKICNAQVLVKNMGMHLHKHAEKFRTTPAQIFKRPVSGKAPIKKISCKICQKDFRSENRLAAHIKKVHEPGKIRFSAKRKHRKNTAKLRISLKKLVKSRSFVCKSCGQEFAALKQLQEHVTKHGLNKKRCPKCKKMFLYKTRFDKHIFQCFYTPSQATLKRTFSLPNTISIGQMT